eukprot:Protomagalhaensia_wolfi_Nauph_80__1358@NODE_180_length_3278_cov_60_680148_g136_i0_p2_GENE_NODE_180_length_3278_cov_60_680148_g136_i0NODE_180_length_3278_cov_60_680148_g136_i0_p2_ORF_typecomplete_len235_score20_03NT5C/PF06941_12/2_8e34HAD_2/PF13419_6/5_3e05HAD/PF12710_7/0_0003Put_Phosphatase/PF06888_12/0_00052Acid_phosphat_B/PF03767_14/0_41Hydrolase/PF00702_26/0_25_NODE_180_length_3278_cov_60_680148_g136_i015632267
MESREVVPLHKTCESSRNCICSDLKSPETGAQDAKLEGIVLVDMDNTLNDWDSQFVRVMKELYPDFQPIDPTQRTDYCMEKNYPPEWTERIQRLAHLRGFWSSMPPAPGAVEAMKEMTDSGLQVWIVSAPDAFLTARCALEKYEWVEAHLGPEWKNRVILAPDKTLVQGDLLIDDKPTATTGTLQDRQSWVHIAYCQPYNMGNRCPGAASRLHNWREWRSVVPGLLRQARKAHY